MTNRRPKSRYLVKGSLPVKIMEFALGPVVDQLMKAAVYHTATVPAYTFQPKADADLQRYRGTRA